MCIRDSIWVDGEPVKSNYKVKPQETITMMLAHPKQDLSLIHI